MSLLSKIPNSSNRVQLVEYFELINLRTMTHNYVTLKSEDFPEISKAQIDDIVRTVSYSEELVYSTAEWSKCLIYYLILTHKPNIVDGRKLNDLDIIVNRYYWLKKFYSGYTHTNGKDIGIEQQISQLIENIGNKFNDFDWTVLQRIDQIIEKSK